MKTRLAIAKCNTYGEQEVEQAISQVVAALGGMKKYIKQGDRVLIKPNLLSGKPPEAAVTTHPAVVKAVLKQVIDAGGEPFIGDSPGIGSARTVAGKAGIKEIADALGVQIIEFKQSIPVSTKGSLQRIEIAKEVLDADIIINLPKLKTHGQMLMSLGVKNIFGCVVGRRKPEWHFIAGKNYDLFAEMLVQLYAVVKPSLTILDGVIGMEGNGPGNGTPRKIGIIMAGTDCVAMDRVVCEIVGIPGDRLFTTNAASRLGIGEWRLDHIEVIGVDIAEVKQDNFVLPRSARLDWGNSRLLGGIIAKAVVSRPYVKKEECKNCKVCVEACPPKAMYLKGNKIKINYHQCIHCYCCHELCPYGAVGIKRGWLSRL